MGHSIHLFIQQVYVNYRAGSLLGLAVQNRHDLRLYGAYNVVREMDNNRNNYSTVNEQNDR